MTVAAFPWFLPCRPGGPTHVNPPLAREIPCIDLRQQNKEWRWAPLGARIGPKQVLPIKIACVLNWGPVTVGILALPQAQDGKCCCTHSS
jgi:hypothetical protein